MTQTGPEDILVTYDAIADQWAGERDASGYEAPWLARFAGVAAGPRILDLGCGSGRPIAELLVERGMEVTGVDGAAGMCRLFAETLPGAPCHHADMRGLRLGARFDGILAWNSFFHLSGDDQRAMFAVFEAHAAPGAALMFTSGPDASEAHGAVAGCLVYHASLSPSEYRDLMQRHGFTVLAFAPNDPGCRGHTIWLARRSGPVSAGS